MLARKSVSWNETALTACLLLAACAPQESPPSPPRPVRAVQVPATAELLARHDYAARIEARHEATLAFEVAGRVTGRAAEVGDRIAAGTVLAQLDATDFRLRERAFSARLTAAKAEHSDAATSLRRLGGLRIKGFVTQAEYDRAAYRDQASAAQVQELTAQLGLTRRELAHTTLRAPTAGVVTGQMLEVGQVVGAGQAAFRLARTDELEAVFDLPEQRLKALPKTVTVTVWSQPDQPIEAQVREVAPQAAADSRTYRVRATLPMANGATPALGMSAEVSFLAGPPVMAVPTSAILKRDDGQPAVWVIQPTTNTVSLRPVTLGPVHGDESTIAGGLKTGDWVVTAGVHDLRDGQPVSLP